MLTARQIACGTRCQLLTGSYNGNTTACPCPSAADCKISEADRKELQDHPDVVDARERCRGEYETLFPDEGEAIARSSD